MDSRLYKQCVINLRLSSEQKDLSSEPHNRLTHAYRKVFPPYSKRVKFVKYSYYVKVDMWFRPKYSGYNSEENGHPAGIITFRVSNIVFIMVHVSHVGCDKSESGPFFLGRFCRRSHSC